MAASRRLPHLPLLPLLLLLPLLSACELTEVTVAPGQRVVVVQSVIHREPLFASGQYVVVEYSQTGDVSASSDQDVPPGSPAQPISNALVTIGYSGSPCAGRVDTLIEQPSVHGGGGSGIYRAILCQPTAGDRMLLRVETPAGEAVTGALTVPGASARDVTVNGQKAPGVFLALDRERDTLRIGVTPTSGRALQVEVRNEEDLNQLAFFAFTDTMGVTLPGNLVNPFEGDSGESIFRAGRYYELAVALTDSNYYDFLRSRSDPFTGRGFINHLTGGIGVFGAVETAGNLLRVVAPVDDPREGVYRITGTLDSIPIDLTLELYLDEVQRDQFSAFVTYALPNGFYANLSGDGAFPPDGSGRMEFHFHFLDSGTFPSPFQLTGIRKAGGEPFPMAVTAFLEGRGQLVDTLTAQQISGPGLATASPRR